ncbi:MAG TPA: hypothetical protein VE136_18905, partial [Anaerolineales bacterium]|nr:hypothetical protein [Anaerolineales bacterium]
MKDRIDQAIRRTQQYWSIDGIPELIFGGIFMLLGIYFLIQAALPPDSLFSGLFSMAFVFIVLGGVFLARRLIDSLKTRLTYPRTGYVAYKRSRGKDCWIAGAFAVVIAGVVSAFFILSPSYMAWIPGVTGILLSGFLVVIGYRLALWRFYGLAAISLMLGVGISLSRISNDPGLAIFYGVMGLAGIISGALTLRDYLQNNPPAQE